MEREMKSRSWMALVGMVAAILVAGCGDKSDPHGRPVRDSSMRNIPDNADPEAAQGGFREP